MIEKVLEAYEAKTTGKKSFWEKLRKMDLLTKIVFWGGILGAIIICVFAIVIPSQGVLISMVIYVIVIYMLTEVIEKRRRSRWKTNLKEYHETLDIIRDILSEDEFNLYDKYKIKQLINKYRISISQCENGNIKKNSNVKEFVCTYIVPVITFFAGNINMTTSTNSEWITMCIVIVVVVVSGKYFSYSIVELVKMISWNQLEKEKHFVVKLQDLLDRDFVIEQDDLVTLE